MRPIYETIPYDLEIYYQKSGHFSPHMHNLVEFVYVLNGTLEIGMDEHLYHMEKGDLAVLFPEKIHHAQCFDQTELSASLYLLASLSLTGDYARRLSDLQPENPVIDKLKINSDIIAALSRLYSDYGRNGKNERERTAAPKVPGMPGRKAGIAGLPETDRVVKQSFIQVILARSMPHLRLVSRPDESQADLVHQIVAYVAEHYREPMTLTSMAEHLYVSPYTISRTFSSVFHTNFNGYLNDMRLDYACSMLHYSDRSVTEVYMDAGFESQRTFNRVFRDRMHMSPREYRERSRTADMQDSSGV